MTQERRRLRAGRDLVLVSPVRRRPKNSRAGSDNALCDRDESKAALSSRLPIGLSWCRSWPDQTGSSAVLLRWAQA
jgi:hypothetical protein